MFFWNEERVNTLTKLWNEGLTASQIAAEIQTTRNAVIGKVHRLGLAGRTRKPVERIKRVRGTPNRKVNQKRSNGSPEPVEPTPVPPPVPVEGGVPIILLESHHCRAVIGTGDDGMARFCGANKEPVKAGAGMSAFCAGHGAIYYNRPVSG